MKENSQRDLRWSRKKLGYGSVSLGGYGCTLTCLSNMAGINPDELNTMLKGSSLRDSAFAGSTKNLINWTKLEKYTNGLIKFHWRGASYNNGEVSKAIKKYGACLVEVDFDGSPRTNDKHWILLIGDKMAIDPWTGNVIPTNKYEIYTGYAVIETKDVSSNTEPMKDNLLEFLGVDNAEDAKKRLVEHLGEKDKKCNWGCDRGAGYLGGEREKNKRLQEELKTCQETKSAITRDLESCTADSEKYINGLVYLLNPDHTQYKGVTKQDMVEIEIKNLLAKEDERLETERKLQQEIADAKEAKKREIEALKAEIEDLKSKLENVSDRVDDVEKDSVTITPETLSPIKKFINTIINMWKKS